MNAKEKVIIEKIMNHIHTEVSDLYEKLILDNKSSLKPKDYVELSDFKDFENLLDISNEYIDSANQKISFMVEVRDGFNQNNVLFADEIHKRLPKDTMPIFESLINDQWILDTIDYHAYRQFKSKIEQLYNTLKEESHQEYLIYKRKSELVYTNFEKIKCGTDFSKVCHILVKLSDFGYLQLPLTKNGKLDKVAVINIFQNVFETDVSNSTIKDYLGSTGSRMNGTFETAVNKSNDDETLIIPPVYHFP